MTRFESLHQRHLLGVLGPALFVAITGCGEEAHAQYGIDKASGDACEEDLDDAQTLLPSVLETTPPQRVVEVLSYEGELAMNADDGRPQIDTLCNYRVLVKQVRYPGQAVPGRALRASEGSTVASLVASRGWIGVRSSPIEDRRSVALGAGDSEAS